MNFILKNRLLAALALFMIVLVPLLGLFSGCASKLQGDQMQNEPPQVGFINSPPESTNFSRNSVIYWWGTDRDGIIDYFRYHVASVTQIGTNTPEQYIASKDTVVGAWTVVDVDIVNSDPGTEQIIKLSADLSDPVNKFVLQYVFLQAFDEEGSASTVVFRIFGRNDNPPNTIIFNPTDTPFVNAPTPGGVITGVKMRWLGEDVIDYPADPPPFEYHYRLYGPYDSAQYAQLTSQFFTKRYLTATGLVYKVGDTIVTCDTTVIFPQLIVCDTLPNGDTTTCDTTTLAPDTTINCTTLIVRTTTPTSAFGSLQDYFFIDSPNFDTSSVYNKIVYESNNPLKTGPENIWVENTGDTIFNVFGNYTAPPGGDTTIQMNCVFWVRARDDALVPDIIPAFKGTPVINPRYERGVLIVDMSTILTPTKIWANSYLNDATAFAFWYNIIKKWADAYGDPSLYLDTARIVGGNQRPDYFQAARTGFVIPISTLLKHKVVILTQEGITKPQMGFAGPNLYKAIDAGVNVWVSARSLGGDNRNQPFNIEPMNPNYARYFGVSFAVYSGWGCHALNSRDDCPQSRIEDFIGAYGKVGWPEVKVDTTRLHYLLRWGPQDSLNSNYPLRWIDGQINYGLPEVGWSVRTFGTELLYRYKSFYGSSHPRGRGADYDFIFEGAPVAHRLNAGLFRTAHMNFTPLVLDTIGSQALADSLLNWLYDPTLGTVAMQFDKPRYPEATLQITVEEARENYRRRVEEYELLNAMKQESVGETEY